MKYVVMTSGVVSGLGNGVAASSIGVVLKACGLRVTFIMIGKFFCVLLDLQFHSYRSCLVLKCSWVNSVLNKIDALYDVSIVYDDILVM